MKKELLPADLLTQQRAKREAARTVNWKWQPYPKQAEILSAPERFLAAFWGRQSGKSTTATRWATEEAIRTQGMLWWVAPTYSAAMRSWGDLLKSIPRSAYKVYKAERRIEFTAGGQIEFHSADNPDALRGETLAGAVFDEAAYIDDYVYHDCVEPMLGTTQGRVLMISTPKTKRGWAYDLYQMGMKGRPDHHAWNMPSSASPYFPAKEIARLRESLPNDSFRREILAEVLDSLNNPLAGAKDVATAQVGRPVNLARILIGADWGRTTDFTAWSVMLDTGNGTGRQLALERFTGLRYNQQLKRFREFIAYWQPESILAEDNNMGGPLVEMLQDEGLPVVAFHTSAQSKEPLIRQFQLGIEQRAVQLLADDTLVSECCDYEEEIDTDVTRFSAPDRQHDDTVIATALSWQALNGAPGGERSGSFEGSVEDWLLRETIAAPLTSAGALWGQPRKRL